MALVRALLVLVALGRLTQSSFRRALKKEGTDEVVVVVVASNCISFKQVTLHVSVMFNLDSRVSSHSLCLVWLVQTQLLYTQGARCDVTCAPSVLTKLVNIKKKCLN